MSNKVNKELKFDEEKGGNIPRTGSSRFQVDRVKSQSEDGIVNPEREDEPIPNPLSSGNNGRFQVEGGEETKDPKLPTPPQTAGTQKSVHFSVGDGLSDTESTMGHRYSTTEGYNTQNVKSFRNVETMEKVPNIDHYRNIMSIEGAMSSTRPTLAQLHEHKDHEQIGIGKNEEDSTSSELLPESQLKHFSAPETKPGGPKFGWIQGVLVRCVLNILGVMLYLRISWVAGQAGIGLGSVIILLSALVTTITTISMCAISTNGEIKGGGAYFMISRSLGPEFGGSIGLIFAFANAVGVAMYVVGFAETVRDIMKENEVMIVDSGLNDIRIIGLATVCVIMIICLIGTGFESKMQMGLLVILLISLINYVVGLFFVTDEKRERGMTGFSSSTFFDNLAPNFQGEEFFSVFGVFFPAATGIMAGANISGDLADPAKSIPKGTLLAILLTTIVYLGGVWFTGSTCVRNVPMDCIENSTVSCQFGLMNDGQVMEMESGWGPLITAGIFAATLSSALASLVSAPKVFQAVCKDRLFPGIHVFAKGSGKSDEPVRSYFLAFTIAVAMILIGDLNSIAPIISNFFLASYALINYACFDASLAESPGFRPGFKYYNMWLSLFGAILCILVMFVIKWWTALLTFVIISALYVYVHYRKPDVNWGSSSQAHSYKSALASMLKLSATEEHVKNYRPQILVLTGNPVARPPLVDFVGNVTKENSLMICGHVALQQPTEKGILAIRKLGKQLSVWLEKRKVKAFYCGVLNPNLRSGVQALLQLGGLGKLKPNILILGFKSNWQKSTFAQIEDYFGILHDAFDSNLGVGILRLPTPLDYSEMMKEHHIGDFQNLKLPETAHPVSNKTSVAWRNLDGGKLEFSLSSNNEKNTLGIQSRSESASSFAAKFPAAFEEPLETSEKADVTTQDETHPLVQQMQNQTSKKGKEQDDKLASSTGGTSSNESTGVTIINPNASPSKRLFGGPWNRQMSVEQKDLLGTMNQFQRKIKKGTIDVWWLFDDGGLTLLIPHLLTQGKSYLEGGKLRVFTIAQSKGQLENEQKRMASLLSKFRIDFSDVFVIPDITRKPTASTQMEFEQLIKEWKGEEEGMISEAELKAVKDRTNRQLRTRELLFQHSKESALVVLTLPVPRRGAYSSLLYMAWLDILTRDMPPILLLRGNQESVLTFYS